jgi:pentatricopeptide repeat protein
MIRFNSRGIWGTRLGISKLCVRLASTESRQTTSTLNDHSQFKQALESGNLKECSTLFSRMHTPRQSQYQDNRWLTNEQRHILLFRKILAAEKRSKLPTGSLTSTELFGKYLECGIAIGWMCSNVIVQSILRGHSQQALEYWVRFLEALGNPELASATLNREAAWSALVAYICNCIDENIEVDAEIALKLVPLKRVPQDNELNLIEYLSALSEAKMNQIKQELAKIRYYSFDYNSSEFISSLNPEFPKELDDKYAEVFAKSKESGVPISEVTYSKFISCFAESTRTQRAFDIWNDMQQANTAATVLSWNSLLRAGSLVRVDKDTVVSHIWNEMEKAGISPNSESYGILIDLRFRDNKIQEALAIFDKIQEAQIPNVTVTIKIFNITVNGLLKAGRIKEAEMMLEEGEQNGYCSSPMVYNSFMRTYIDSKLYDKTIDILDRMDKMGIEPDIVTYSNVIDSAFKMARVNGTSPRDNIEKLINEMARNKIKANTIAMTSIISGLIKTDRDIEGARMLFDAMLKKRIVPNARTFATIIDGELQVGEVSRALAYFTMMPRYNLRKSTSIYNQLIKGLARKGDLKGAFEMFTNLVKDPATFPNKFSYYFILQACEERGNFDVAQRVIDELSKQLDKTTVDLGDRGLPVLIKKLSASITNFPSNIDSLVQKTLG